MKPNRIKYSVLHTTIQSVDTRQELLFVRGTEGAFLGHSELRKWVFWPIPVAAFFRLF